MASKTDIWNLALAKLGTDFVNTPLDNLKGAIVFSKIHNMVLDGLIQEHTWNFATKRAKLVQSGTPLFGFDYEYQLPADCLQVFQVDKDHEVWQREGDKLLTNYSPVYIKYGYRVENTERYPALFVSMLAERLALAGGFSLTKNKEVLAFINTLEKDLFSRVKTRDAQESGGDSFKVNTFTGSRNSEFVD